MRVVLFVHSLASDWNHGNAHFLRGIARELVARGHSVASFEPTDSWSARNLVEDQGSAALDAWRAHYPELSTYAYDPGRIDLDALLDGADLVLVHEWNAPALVRRIGRHRAVSGHYLLLFHDTHHRSVSDPASIGRATLDGYDGVLAFGEAVAEQYRRRGWSRRTFVWHEAADLRQFGPRPELTVERDLVWIGNWGDEERSAELHEFLVEPVAALALRARIHGVRYPVHARTLLRAAGIDYAGYLPNPEVPEAFARARTTVHVPRRPYARQLPGIPTIRVFEALACGIPLVCAPWSDSEGLFTPGRDYLEAADGAQMRHHLRLLLNEPAAADELARQGRATVAARHGCTHRVDALLDIMARLSFPAAATEPA